jgi:hypothetical protein
MMEDNPHYWVEESKVNEDIFDLHPAKGKGAASSKGNDKKVVGSSKGDKVGAASKGKKTGATSKGKKTGATSKGKSAATSTNNDDDDFVILFVLFILPMYLYSSCLVCSSY